MKIGYFALRKTPGGYASTSRIHIRNTLGGVTPAPPRLANGGFLAAIVCIFALSVF